MVISPNRHVGTLARLPATMLERDTLARSLTVAWDFGDDGYVPADAAARVPCELSQTEDRPKLGHDLGLDVEVRFGSRLIDRGMPMPRERYSVRVAALQAAPPPRRKGPNR
ncbi:MAG: hypothetical protein KDA83_20050 [Planctomycetales bacterium]|nr:hypothetical protein [Planctomycetales bacterium]